MVVCVCVCVFVCGWWREGRGGEGWGGSGVWCLVCGVWCVVSGVCVVVVGGEGRGGEERGGGEEVCVCVVVVVRTLFICDVSVHAT